MFKKINILLVLLLLIVSITAVSASDDNSIIANENILNEEDAGNNILTSNDEEMLSDNSHNITNANYNTYFNSNGELISSEVNEGDTIEIIGNFENVNFTFKKSLKIIGSEDVNLKNCVFTLTGGASGSSVSNLKIFNTENYHYGIFLNGVSNCIIKDCFVKNEGVATYAICLGNGANYNNVTNNNFHTTGITYGHGTRSTPPVLISGSHHNYIANNNVSCWDANGIYLSSYSGGPLSGGASNFNIIYNNTINYLVLPTSWSYGIQIMGSENIIDSNKIIKAYRGISTSGSGNKIINNKIINITGADYNNPTVEIAGEYGIAGSYNTTIINNTIINSKIIASGAGISAFDYSTIENNTVQVIYKGVGINPQGSYINVINNNISTISGSGILFNTHSFNLTVIENNIRTQSAVGILIQKLSSKRMPGNITIVRNVIYLENNKVYAIDAKDADKSTDNLIEDNYAPNDGEILTPDGIFDASKPIYKYKGTTYTITPLNYDNYIQTNYFLNSTIKDEDILIFEGEFVNKLNVIINKAVKIVGHGASFSNTTFKIYSDGVWIENLTIKNSNASKLNAWGILAYKIAGATIYNCDIEVYDSNAAYAVYVVESTYVDVINNTLFSSGDYLTYTLLAYAVDDCNFINNTIKTVGTNNLYINTGMDTCIDGDENCVDGDENCLDGDSFNGNHVVPAEVYRTYGILILYSSENTIFGNKVNATSKLNETVGTTESTNSIVGIDLYYNSHNNIFSNNEIYIKANDNYIYGMGVLGYKSSGDAPEGQGASNNQFINNNIILDGTYFVEGFVVGRNSFDTIISSNNVNAKSSCVNYGINLEMSQNSMIDKNNFTLNSDIVYGIESFESNSNNISNNDFKINAKKVYGMLLSNSKYNKIYGNIIFANGTDEDITFVNFDSLSEGNAGMYLNANSTNNVIEDNNITSNFGFAVLLDNNARNNLIQNNYLDSQLGFGNAAVNNSENNIVEYNYKYLVTGEFHNITIKYFEKGMLIFTSEDTNLNGAKIEFIDGIGIIINSTIISNGNASFVYDFKDYTPALYEFFVKIYQDNYKVDKFSCMVNIIDGDLIVHLDDASGAIARSTQFNISVKNILGEGVSGITVDFYIDDEGYEEYIGKATTGSNGLATLNGIIPNIYGDNPKIIAKIKDPYHFQSTSAEANLTAFWLTNTNIALNNNICPNAALAVLKDSKGNLLSNKQVTITVDGKLYYQTTNSKGVVLMPVVSKGVHAISVSFAGDEQYYDSKNSAKITVLQSLYENKDQSVYYGNTIQYKVRVKGSDGKYGAGNMVTIKINGKTYKVKTDKNGYAALKVKLKTGSYTISSEFNGDKVVNKLTFKPTLSAKNIVKKKSKNIKFSVKVVNKNGKIVKNKKISFKIKGKKYTAKTNKKGVATVSIKNLKVGKYTITSTYAGCSIKNTIKIKK